LGRENQALWQELTLLRQRHEHQRAMIGKIMQFLSRLVSRQSAIGNRAMPSDDAPNAKRAK
jgi:hypothetical protein